MNHIYIQNTSIENQTFAFNPNNEMEATNWNFFHTYLYDYKCVNLESLSNILDDSLFSYSNNFNFSENFQNNHTLTENYINFINFFTSLEHEIYHGSSYYKDLSLEEKVISNIRFLILDNITNPNLINIIKGQNEVEYIKTGIYFETSVEVCVIYPKILNILMNISD